MGFDWRRAARLRIGIGGGQIPTRRRFRLLPGPIWVISNGVHINPRFYKHYWQIWTSADAIPDEELWQFKRYLGPYPWLALVPELSFSEAIRKMRELCDRGERFLVSDERVKRADPTLWNVELIKSKGGRLAPIYEDDPDEPFFGHK